MLEAYLFRHSVILQNDSYSDVCSISLNGQIDIRHIDSVLIGCYLNRNV
jgi:hypothetical protein